MLNIAGSMRSIRTLLYIFDASLGPGLTAEKK